MADNSVALGRGSGPDLFADDDPLAELARIAGYDERPSQRFQPNARQAEMPGSQSRHEPAFNLEDELLREFESYEAPRLDPSDDLPLGAPVADAANPNVRRPDADHSRRSYSLDDYPETARVTEPRGRDPFADLDDLDAGQVPQASPAPSADATFSQGRHSEGSSDWNRHVVQPDRVAEPAFDRADPSDLDGVSRNADPVRAVPEPSVAQPVMDENFELDLISELETSLVAAPVPVARKTSSRPPAKAYEPGFRMPLANFHRAPERTGEPPMTAAPSAPAEPRFEPAPLDMAGEDLGWDMRAAPPSSFEQPAPAGAERRSDLFDPELLPSDFARDVPDVQTFEPVSAPSNAAPKERFSPQEEPVYDVGHYSARSSQPRAPDVVEPAFAPHGLDMAPAAKKEPAPLDLLNEDDFELSLEELELDFSDLLADEPRAPAPVPAPSSTAAAAPARSSAPVELPVATREAMPSAAVAPAPFATRPQAVAPSVSPVVPAFLASSRSAAGMAEQPSSASPRAAAVSAPVADVAPDAFDPALFADTEEMLESVPDLNVPDLPVHEPEQRPVVHSDFDLHLDQELASLFETHTAQPAGTRETPRSRATPSAAQSIAAVAPAPQQPLTANEFDDFERALEEDFRRTLSQPIQPGRSDGPDEGEEDLEAYYEAPRRTSARWIVPASVAGLVLVAGVSAYAWYAGGTSGMSGNGAPVVIAADTDAVKVAPENPGGKTVPNQDKAVYDRVAGGALNDPKQSSLISSDEQPMDVVQKTLMPDNLPMEGEEDGAETASTEVGDTQDPRLLPQQAAAQSGQQAGEQLAVMPRRVKTMIVRPDGTLVEQVSDVTAQASTQARPVRAETVAASPALAEPKSVAGITPISQPQGTAPTELASVDVEQTTALTGTQDAAASETTPAPQFAAPVPTARPSRQPTNVVATAADAVARPIQASAPASAPAASSGAGGYYIQVASLPSEAEAQKSYANISSKFASVVSGRAHDIARADIAGKGTYYRVRIAAGSTKDEAAALCERYRAAGGTCLIAR